MFAGCHGRGWLLMGLLFTLLLVVAIVPIGYFQNHKARTVYVAVVIPVAWLLYLLLLYIIVYRPLTNCTAIYARGESCDTRNGANRSLMVTKEIHKLNRNLRTLTRETADLKAATAMLTRQLEEENIRGPIA